MMNLANMLSLSRAAILPFIIILLFLPQEWAWASWTALVLYIIGAITDYADGWVARRYNQVSEFGRFVDPIVDKIFVVSMLVLLVAVDRIAGIFVMAVIIILVREFVVAGLREFLGSKDIKLPVTQLAKWKTALQMTATGMLIVGHLNTAAHVLGLIGLCAAAGITAWTGWIYVRDSYKHMQG